MSGYSADWPLWDRTGQMDPSALDISDELTDRLYAWQGYFERWFHYEFGWRSVENGVRYAEEGKELQRLLTAAVGRWVHVELDLWPVLVDQEDVAEPEPESTGLADGIG